MVIFTFFNVELDVNSLNQNNLVERRTKLRQPWNQRIMQSCPNVFCKHCIHCCLKSLKIKKEVEITSGIYQSCQHLQVDVSEVRLNKRFMVNIVIQLTNYQPVDVSEQIFPIDIAES